MSLLKYLLEVIDVLDDPKTSGSKVKELLKKYGHEDVKVDTLRGERGTTDFVKITFKSPIGSGPTLNIIGRLGGVGARPLKKGLVSDADGAIVALTVALKLADMWRRGEFLEGKVIITTHITPNAPIIPYKPAPMMTSPIDLYGLMKYEVDPKADAVISIDATKANLVIKAPDFAITPTIKDGWILKVSDDLIRIYRRVTGHQPYIVPITMQDIVPYTVNVYHINSMVQPWLYTHAPVVGVATTSQELIAGSDTGVSDFISLERASRFVVEVAKEYTSGNVKFYDEDEFKTLVNECGDVGELFRRKIRF